MPLPVIIASSPFLQRGSQYILTHHLHPLTIACSAGGEETLREEDYPSALDHVIEIQDAWVTSRTFLHVILFNALYV